MTAPRGSLAKALLCATIALSPGRRSAADDAVSLFNGRDFDGWTAVDGLPVAAAWEVRDGAIHLRPGERGGHIVTQREYGDFRLAFEWKMARGVNSGLKYHVRLYDGKLRGLEYQLLDDARFAAAAGPRHRLGALYDLFAADPPPQPRPFGEYNASLVVVQFPRVEHWLNGQRIVEATIGSDAWRARLAESKFQELEGFAQAGRGRIMLTDHGGEIWYRKLVLTPFPRGDAPPAAPPDDQRSGPAAR